MKVVYLEGESTILAEAEEIAKQGNTLFVRFPSGKVIQRGFPSPELLDDFFEEVILTAGDKPIRLENTNFAPQLGQLMEDWDSLYED